MAGVVELMRGHVKADNSCLFTAMAQLCEGIMADIPLQNAARKLRARCGELALADPDPVTRALLLGHDSVQAYAEWIQTSTNWGGEPEIAYLASHYEVEIVVCSAQSLSFLRYGGGGALKGRVYLLYTGQHYDPLHAADGTLVLPHDEPAGMVEVREASALELARAHNADAARRATERRVQRLKCSGCGVLCDDAAAFEAHCGEVEHGDDFTYECESVEVVIGADEALPEGTLDLTDLSTYHVFYNAADADAVSLSMRCVCAPFELEGGHWATLEELYKSETLRSMTTVERRAALVAAVRTQCSSEVGASSGLRAHLLSTLPKTIVCIDIDPWLGMQAAGGISSGQNVFGKILMEVRDELLAAVSG